ncbi:hypothetical protein QA634_19700 [Methylobacterium sp. CB376]|uniref:hypothetical protein n=1 Tax=unclassified Methylobacterium TaxID=2615210 RepID=UPI00123778C7|nr:MULTISPECIES: hypothetical protein [Methylobacterium]WFT77549.1 hypothetical protein QA634_19700 [Methylobacterium nodulans]
MVTTSYLDIPQLLLSDAADVVGMEFNTLRSWIQRGAVYLSKFDQKPKSKGGRTIITLRSMYCYAIMNELVKFGFSPDKAGIVATEAVRYTLFVSVAHNPEDLVDLEPGQLFPEGKTFLVTFGHETFQDPEEGVVNSAAVNLVNVRTGDQYAQLFEGSETFSSKSTRLIINLNILYNRVNERLADLRSNRRGS